MSEELKPKWTPGRLEICESSCHCGPFYAVRNCDTMGHLGQFPLTQEGRKHAELFQACAGLENPAEGIAALRRFSGLIHPMNEAPRDGSWIIALHIESNPPRSKAVRWSDNYSIHGLGGHWTDGVGQYGHMHFAGWIDGTALGMEDGGELDCLRRGMVSIAALFGITDPIQLIARAKNNEQTYVDILREVITEQLAASKSENERLRAALERIAGAFTPEHKCAIDRWEGSGTECFEDLEWMDAASVKPLAEIAKQALAGSGGKEVPNG